jgi:hypothetical protein
VHAPADAAVTIAVAATPDAAVVEPAPDAAVVAAPHVDAAVVVAVHHDAAAVAIVEPASDEANSPNVLLAEQLVATGQLGAALLKARAAINDPSSSDVQKARALGIKGDAECRNVQTEDARADVLALRQLSAHKEANKAIYRITDSCKKAGNPL